MRGRRLPDAVIRESGPGWDAWEDRQPGDYMKVEAIGWYICDPLGHVGLIGARRVTLEKVADLMIPVVQDPIVEPWSIAEHDDGTITVRPSIAAPNGYHGWLERGEWRNA